MDHVVILATSDIHGNICGYDYKNSKEITSGMARLYTYVQKVRAWNDSVFLFDAGDALFGGPVPNNVMLPEEGSPHPVIEAMNCLSYDAASLGNHDFDMGTGVLKKMLSAARFPVVTANVFNPDGSLFTELPGIIIEKNGCKIACIGADTPFLNILESGKDGVSELKTVPASEALKTLYPELKKQADAVIVCAHMGGCAEFDTEKGSDSAFTIADSYPDLDILHMAHTHFSETGKRGNVLFGETKDLLNEILRFDIFFDEDKEILKTTVKTVSLKDYDPADIILNLPSVKAFHKKALARFSEGFEPEKDESAVIGEALRDYDRKDVMQLINEAQLMFSGADISATAVPDETAVLKKGPVTEKMIENICRFPNFLSRVTVTGEELKNYIEWGLECRMDGSPVFLQDWFSGLSFDIDKEAPRGKRAYNITFHGAPLDPSQRLMLVLSSYRLNTVLIKEGIIRGEDTMQFGITVKEVFTRFIKDYLKKE